MTFIKFLNNSLEKTDPLLDWWFAGILVVFYFIVNNVSPWKGETLELAIYLFAFFFALLIFLMNIIGKLKYNPLTMAVFSLPFYILIILDFTPSLAHLIFLIASVLLCIGDSYSYANNEFQFRKICWVIYYFLFFHIASKLVYWATFDEFIWVKVLKSSQYYKYSNIIEQITPIVVITIFFLSLILILYSLKKDFFWEPLKRFWWFVPAIFFFAESFSTSGFFLKEGGRALYHWQPYVGVIEMIDQGGSLLWDTPSTYGFLSLIFPYLIPFGNAWQKIYIINGILNFAFGLLLLKIIWNKKGLIWYMISIGMTMALVYYLPGGENMNNLAETPNAGAMRFFWVVLLMYTVVMVREKDFKSQINFITPVWLVGFLWSVESAFFVSAVLGPYVLFHLFLNPEKSFKNIKYLAIIPFSLVIAVISISLFYLFKLGHLPDYYAFIEEAVRKVEGFNSVLFTIRSPLWVHVIIMSWLLSQIHKKQNNIHFLFSIWVGVWAVTSWSIVQSRDISLIKLLPIYFFALFISFIIIDYKNDKKFIAIFAPIFVMILTITFGNPKSIKHFFNTINNQDYTLKKASFDEGDDFHQILTKINPGQTPIVYIDETRYLHFLSKREYIDVNNNRIIPLSKKIWLPLHPTSLLHAVPYERQIVYINRWLNRHPTEEGWIIRPIEHWAHSYYKKALKKSLSDEFHVKKSIEHGILKADLYARNN